jgi:hypothetical protein
MIAKPELLLGSGGIRTIEFRNFAAYGLRVVKPVINIEEKIGKTVGRRGAPDPLKIQPGETADAAAWSRAFPSLRGVRPGVYRFHSHEEADEWLMKHLTRKTPS